ncbi:DUF6478 family protein [Pseudaestuariivita sp.]|uniref:DUF6478 family protein n=1 Tax=Pseudaestuariivita sp. TaxID=2211669 RepID=UPI004057E30A
MGRQRRWARGSRFDRWVQGAALKRWEEARAGLAAAPLSALRETRGQARQLRAELDRLLFAADARLAQGGNATRIDAPHGADWTWRPEVWTGPLGAPGLVSAQSQASLGAEIKLFHDCPAGELTLRQTRSRARTDHAPYGLSLDVLHFQGSYLSLAVDLPDAAHEGLRKRHIVRADFNVRLERPIELFARLNVKHGPNTEQVVREVPVGRDGAVVEFDLAYTAINEKRVSGMWMDVIFENPWMNRVEFRDLTMMRFPRAEM